MSAGTHGRPTVGVVVPTHDRPELLRVTLASVLEQEADADLDVVVVFDRNTPDRSLEALGGPGRRVRVMANARTPGLAGSRNTGILALATDWVAFCDDDDTWAPGKLAAQLARAAEHPDAEVLTTAICVAYEGAEVPRLAGTDVVHHADLLRSRMAMLHSSTLLLRRTALTGPLGLVDEAIPGSQNEDWDLLLRAARRAPIVHLDEPLVRVLWGRTSHYAYEYATKISSLRWMMQRHPEISGCKPGAARVYGQLACWSAASGNRSQAWQFSKEAVRANWREPRTAIALAAMTGAVKVENVLSALHKRGRGI